MVLVQGKMKAVKKALEILSEKTSIQKTRIVSDSQLVFMRLQNLLPAFPLKQKVERDILTLLHTLNDKGCQVAFTWCPSHCGVAGNELADVKAKERTTVNQSSVGHYYDSAKATIRKGKTLLSTRDSAECMVNGVRKSTAERKQSCQGKSRRWWADWKAAIILIWNISCTRWASCWYGLQKMRPRRRNYGTYREWLPTNPPPSLATDTPRHLGNRPPTSALHLGEMVFCFWPPGRFTTGSSIGLNPPNGTLLNNNNINISSRTS